MIEKCIEYPPYLFSILQHHACVALTYTKLWNQRDEQNIVKVQKKHIKTKYLIPNAKFNHDILTLVSEGVANVEEKKHFFKIHLKDSPEDVREKIPC